MRAAAKGTQIIDVQHLTRAWALEHELKRCGPQLQLLVSRLTACLFGVDPVSTGHIIGYELLPLYQAFNTHTTTSAFVSQHQCDASSDHPAGMCEAAHHRHQRGPTMVGVDSLRRLLLHSDVVECALGTRDRGRQVHLFRSRSHTCAHTLDVHPAADAEPDHAQEEDAPPQPTWVAGLRVLTRNHWALMQWAGDASGCTAEEARAIREQWMRSGPASRHVPVVSAHLAKHMPVARMVAMLTLNRMARVLLCIDRAVAQEGTLEPSAGVNFWWAWAEREMHDVAGAQPGHHTAGTGASDQRVKLSNVLVWLEVMLHECVQQLVHMPRDAHRAASWEHVLTHASTCMRRCLWGLRHHI